MSLVLLPPVIDALPALLLPNAIVRFVEAMGWPELLPLPTLAAAALVALSAVAWYARRRWLG